jgi:catechol 2,3-dioxygenase-like lactoylglutathione lyase family enzyme
MPARIAEKSLRHVSVCVSDLAKAKAFYGDLLGLEELPRPDLGVPGVWLRVGGDLQLHLIENPERVGADRRLSIADPHFALWTSDVRALVDELRGKGLELLENKPRAVSFQQAYLKDPDGNMVEFIGPATPARGD